MDIRRIPILSLSSTVSMTDLMSELPLPSPHSDPLNQSLWYNHDIFVEASKILNSNNKAIFDSIAKSLSNTSTDEIILKESSQSSVKMNMNAIPSIFHQMVKRDIEKFKDKVGFEDFFIKENPPTNEPLKVPELLNIKEKVEKTTKKKKKKHKEVEIAKNNSIKLDKESYSVSLLTNKLKLSFKKIKPPLESSTESSQSLITSLPNLPVENSKSCDVDNKDLVIVPPKVEGVLNDIESQEKLDILTKTKIEKTLEITPNHISEDIKPIEDCSKVVDECCELKAPSQHCAVADNYFVNITGLNHATDMFSTASMFESDVNLQAIEISNPTQNFLDTSAFKSNPHSNSLSVNELQLTESSVKNDILDIDYNRQDCDNNSPVHDDTQSYNQNNQQFGLAAYLTKPTSVSNNMSTNQSDIQPGSCMSAAPNSVDNYDPKTNEASILESLSVQMNNPNSAQSEFESAERKLDKRGKSRGRNKELENLMKWQIKDKGMPQIVDPLDSATVGPGERVKKRTRRCVRRNERDDCSSISENSYHTMDISPAAPEIAQTNHSAKSDSSFDEEIRLSTPQPPTIEPSLSKPFSSTPSPFEFTSESFNHLPFNDNAQSKSSSLQIISQDINFNSTDIASSLASITPDEDLPEVTGHSKIVMKGKKLPNKIDNKVSDKTPIKDCLRMDIGSNRGSLPVEITGDISDNSSESSDYMPKTKLKPPIKRQKKSKNPPYLKTGPTSDSRLQHLFGNKETKLISRERVFRASQYNRNMNPIVVLSPLPNDYDDYNEFDSPSSTSTMSTLPFTYEHELELLSSDFETNQNKSKQCEHLKNQFFTFLDSLLKDVEELDLLNIVSNYKNPVDLEFLCYNDNDAKLSSNSLNLLNHHVAKMKTYNLMHLVPVGKLVRLLILLLVNMNSFVKVPNDAKKKVQKSLQEQLLKCLDASLIALSIMISPDMPRAVFLEEVIENACDLFRTILKHNIYPIHDSNIKSQPNSNDVLLNIISNISINKYQNEFLAKLTARVQCGINCLSELMQQHPNRLTDEAILKLTSLAISSLSVNNIDDVQQSLIPLLAAVFCQYEGHRKSVVSDLLSIMTHSQNKKVVKKYKINNDEDIQTITAVILLLFQSVVQKPKTNKKNHSNKSQPATDFGTEQNVVSNLNSSIRIMQIFVHTFFKKICFKGEESYKLSFERFVQDLFLTFNKPEWPAASYFLNYIGTTLICHLNTSQTNRNVAIDLLGTICAFMCQHINIDNYNVKISPNTLRELILNICKTSQSKAQNCDLFFSKSEDEQIRLLKSLLLNFLTLDASDSTCMYARRYWVGSWLQDLISSDNVTQNSKSDNQIRTLSKVDELWKINLLLQLESNCDEMPTFDLSGLSYENACSVSRFLSHLKDVQNFEMYLSRICKSLDENSVPARTKSIRSLTLVLEEDPSLLMKADIEKSVNQRFLDSSTAVREATVDLVGKFLMRKPELVTQYYPVLINRIVDTGTSVRKRVIKVLWDICTTQSDFPNAAEVYAKIMKRMNDEESIKKLVNEVFKRIWFTPISDKDPVKLQLRIFSIANVIHALGNDQKCNHNWVFQFISQLSQCESDQNTDLRAQRSFEKSYQQIVECLVQTVLRLQDVSSNSMELDTTSSQNSKSVLSSQQKLLCSTWSALHIFSKVRPKLVGPYLGELSLLVRQIRAPGNGGSLKQTLILNNDMAICMNHLCGTLDAGLGIVQNIEDLECSNIRLSKENLDEITNDLINLATNAPSRFIVDSAIKCLRRVTGFTQEFSGIRNCFSKFFINAMRLTEQAKLNPKQWQANDSKLAILCRILYTSVGLCRYFDMKELLNEKLLPQSNSVFSRLLNITIYCAENFPRNCESRNRTIFNMNHLVHKDHELLVSGPINKFYISTLNLIHNEKVLSNDSARMITCVLDNISNFLKHNELKMVEENSTWKSRADTESLKTTNDVSGSFGNVVAQLYLKLVLDCCMVGRTEVRLSALTLVCKILSQGLVQPMLAMGYLIALQGDLDNGVRGKADSQLTELNSKYQGFLNIRAIAGVRLSYKLQTAIVNMSKKDNESDKQYLKPVRGWSYVSGNTGQSQNNEQNNNFLSIQATNHQLYSSLRRNKQHWRSFLDGMVNLFDESHQCDLTELIFIADQLASFPYQIQEEPVFLVHKLDLLLSVVGPTILRCCKDVFKLFSKTIADRAYKDGELSSNELIILVKLLSESSFENMHLVFLSIKSSRVSLLMIALKEYIKNVYGIVDNKISSYSPESSSKQWEKPVFRNVNADLFEIPEQCLRILPDPETLKSCDVSLEIVRQLVLDYLDFRNKMIVIDIKGKSNDIQNEVPTLDEFIIGVEKSKFENVSTKKEIIDNRNDSKNNENISKTKITKSKVQSESESTDSSITSNSVKKFTPKKQKFSYSSNNRVPIAGKEIPNHNNIKDTTVNNDKPSKFSNGLKKSNLLSNSMSSNKPNKTPNKTKVSEKNSSRPTLTSLPSDFLGNTSNNANICNKFKPSSTTKSFKTTTSNADIDGTIYKHKNNSSDYHNQSERHNQYNKNSSSSKLTSKNDEKTHKRFGRSLHPKKSKKRKRMVISSSSDSSLSSD